MPGQAGTFHPKEIARAYREENPNLFNDLEDYELIRAIKEEDPEVYALIDPMLYGMELLGENEGRPAMPTGRWTPAPPPPPQLPKASGVVSTGLRVVPAIGGSIIGGLVGGAGGSAVAPGPGTLAGGVKGAMVGGGIGSGLGEAAAQWYESKVGDREQYSPGAVIWETGLGAIPLANRGATLGRRLITSAGQGALLGGGGTAGRAVIERGELPTVGEVAAGTVLGSVFGAGTQAGVEGMQAGYRAARQATGFADDLTGSLPVEAGPPPSMADQLPMAWAAEQQYRAEEQRLAAGLARVYGANAAKGARTDYHTALEAKSYLEELAALNQAPIPIPPIQPGLTARSPYAADAPLMLPEQAGLGAQAPPGTIYGYPPGMDPTNLVDVVGPGARILGPTAEYGPPPPPPVQDFDPLGPKLTLSPPPPPPPAVPREAGLLTGRQPRPRFAPALQQSGRMGGRRPTAEQPRLPGSDQPAPLDNRPYATGPNAGPRRRGEAHAQPRILRRQVKQPDGSLKYEDYPSTRMAEDPGTYPPEVRRELATIADELDRYRYSQEPGGVTVEQIQGMKQTLNSDTATAISEIRRRGASSGGAIPGAPIYHDIIAAAEGSFRHVTREKMLNMIRAALLEGKGNALTDAAAEVARMRLRWRKEYPQGYRRSRITESGETVWETPIINKGGDEGDEIIGWVDDEGNRAMAPWAASEEVRAAREAEDGELVAAIKAWASGEIPEAVEPFVVAARAEAVRRGLIEPEQPGLRMEGPGGDKGPSLFDFEGAPPPEPPKRTLEQPSLPGAEGVREQNIPTPEVAEVPFALVPPPPPKPAPKAQPSLWDKLQKEEGILVLRVPANDRPGLRKWHRALEQEHGGEAWYSRMEQAMDEGDWDRAWKIAASASVRSYTKAVARAKTPEQERALLQAVKGTALQDDIATQIVAGARQRAGVGTAPPVKDFPPSTRVTQAGAARGKATLGPAGILNPGPRQRPLSSAAPETRAATLDNTVVRMLIDGLDPEMISTIPGNQDTFLRLFRQGAEQIYRGENLKLLREAGIRLPPEELAQHFNATISDAGRTLQMLSAFAQANREVLTEAAEKMSMGGALRGMLGMGEGPPPTYAGRGRGVLSGPGQQATQEVVDELARRTNRYQAAALANDLQKRKPIGPLRALHDASYAWMLSKWNTAVRNYISFTGRYGVEALDHALTIPMAKILGDQDTAALSSALLRERGVTPFRTGTAVSPRHSWAEDLQGIYDFTVDNLNTLKPKDARRAIALLLNQPEHMAEYLGTLSGEDLSAGFSNTPVLRYLTNPKVQRFLTMFNRAQEFSARATVFDATTRALLRAKGLDPNHLLQRPVGEIIEAVGGQRAFDDLLFTATAQSLEATFAGRTSKDSIPGALIRFINDAWQLKLGIPFPRFNFSAAPRWIYDHSPAALLDWIRFPLDMTGITAPRGTAAGGRLYRGVRAQQIQQRDLPLLTERIGRAERAQGVALQELLATQREFQVRGRQIKRLEARAQQGLPNVAQELDHARELQAQLGRRREQLKAEMHRQRTIVSDLKSEEKTLLNRVQDATAINAPNFAQSLARMGVGTVGMLGAAWIVRAQEGAQGTRWYEFRVDREGKDPIILDFRPFAPFAQYLFVADVLNDFNKNTDWQKVREDVGTEEEGMVASPLDWSRAIWNRYEGKYTEAELGTQFAQAFLSISRAAGTTLTLTDLMTQNGWPSLEDAARAIVGTMGQFLSRFTVPFQQVSDVVGQWDPEEAKVRTPPKATFEDWERPLAGPLANVPYARQVIPERVSQTTGKAVASEYPLLRGLAGVGTSPRDFVMEEVRRIGVPGQSVFIRETGDVGLDRMVAESYARVLQQELPPILESEDYQQLRTPARKRDYLQRYVFPVLKRAALGEARLGVGEERYGEATVRGENARRQQRMQSLIEELDRTDPVAEELRDLPLEAEPPPLPPGGPTLPEMETLGETF